MGYLRHQCAVAHSWGYAPDVAAMDAMMQDINTNWQGDIYNGSSNPIVIRSGEMVNGSITWLFAVDGSKEGWDTSTRADELRSQFLCTCCACKYVDAFDLVIGGDDDELVATPYSRPKEG